MSDQPQPESSFSNQALRQQMAAAFNFAELRALCFDVGIPFEELGGESQGVTAVIIKLLEAAERHGRLEALIAACARERPGLNWPTGPRSDHPCPYRGLFAFQEEDKHLFYGREAFTEILTVFVLARPLTAVIGPSGSGKSSVVFAGLVPALRKMGEWLVVRFRPGERPFNALAAVLLPHLDPTLSKVDQLAETKKLAERLQAGDLTLADTIPTILEEQPANTRLLLIADQFEELFTLYPDAETRHYFLDLLLNETASKGDLANRLYNIHFVLTLRADFMGQALAYPPLVAALQNNDVKLGPMAPDELRRAIVEPAKQANVQFEEGLVDRILDDVGTDGRNLPLLEFALTELWQQQSNRRLTHAAYERIGQVRGALARHADAVYDNLTPEEQTQAERIFVQLVHPSTGAEDTRRLATKAEIDDVDWTLVQHLADAKTRLLVTDQDESGQETAEVIHEALIQRWQQLQNWMDIHRDFRAWQERLRADLQLWLANEKEEGYLLQGAPLSVAQEWLEKQSAEISEAEFAYIQASSNRLAEIEAEKELQRQRELEQERRLSEERRRTNIRLGILAVVALISAAGAIFFGVKSSQNSQQIAAEAQSRVLAAQADRLRFNDDLRGSLIFSYLAANATFQRDKTVTGEAFNALFTSLSQMETQGILFDDISSVTNVVFSPSGNHILTVSNDNTARLWDINGNFLAALDGHIDKINKANFSPPGNHILTASNDHTAKLWDSDGNLISTFEGHVDWVNTAVFSPSGNHILTASNDHTAKLWDISGNLITTLEGHIAPINNAVFSSSGNYILTASNDFTAKLWDKNGRFLITLEGHVDWVNTAVFSPSGNHILTASNDHTAKLWDISGNLITTLEGHTAPINNAVFSSSGNYILTASNDFTAKLWDRNGRFLTALEGHVDWVNTAIFSPSEDHLLTASNDRTVRLWDKNGNQLAVLEGFSGARHYAIFSPNGNRILTTGEDGHIELWLHYEDVESMLAEAKRRLLLLTIPEECIELFTQAECENR